MRTVRFALAVTLLAAGPATVLHAQQQQPPQPPQQQGGQVILRMGGGDSGVGVIRMTGDSGGSFVISIDQIQALIEPLGPTGVDTGKRAPSFALPWADKDRVGVFELKEAIGKPVVLAFYPKDFTSGCTAQMKTFTEQYDSLFGPDVVVVGISADSLETHQRFAKSLGLPFKLLSDPDQKVAQLFESAGPNGYNKRTVYVIDKKGKVAYRNMKFGAIDPQAYAELKAAVQQVRSK
jgi:peroxiredoxin Q/BCP